MSHPRRALMQIEARLPVQSLQTMRRVIAPKLGAVEHFHRAAPADATTLSLVFSSVSSLAGLSAHANYSAANAALDAFAQDHASTGTGPVAVQWGAWAAVGKCKVTAIRMHKCGEQARHWTLQKWCLTSAAAHTSTLGLPCRNGSTHTPTGCTAGSSLGHAHQRGRSGCHARTDV